MERVSVEPTVLLDRVCGVPLTAQLSGQLREAVRQGRIGAGDRLPSTRAFATALGVSRTVVTDAYAQLYAEGWLEGRRGSGTFIAAGTGSAGSVGAAGCRGTAGAGMLATSPITAVGATGLGGGASRPRLRACTDSQVIDLQPGVPWAADIDRAAWRRAWRRAGAAELDPTPQPVADPGGLPELRAALTGYLRRSRGVSASPADIIVTRGIGNGLDLIAAALLRPGDTAGIEEPGWPAARSILAARGARLVPCPVDDLGLVVEALPAGLRLIHTTPAHQTPLGGRLPVPRRQALLGWARRTGALIVEDDYDSEFRYDVAPLPALHSLDPGVVAYLGTTAKTLTPELGVGWLVASRHLLDLVTETRLSLADRTATVVQRATASLIEDGHLERHVRRMRHVYARRRSVITGILAALPPPARLLGDTAGIHVVLELPAAAATAAAEMARGSGVAVATLDRYLSAGAAHPLHGLVIGYGGATLPQVRKGCEILRDIVEQLVGS